MKIREAIIWILRTLFHSLSVAVLLPGPYAGWLIFLFNYFQLEKKNPALWAWAQLPMEKAGGSVSLPICSRAGSLPHTQLGRERRCARPREAAEKGAAPRPRERKAPCPVLGRQLHLFKPLALLSTQRAPGIQGSTCFSYRRSHPARSALWMCIWETSESPFFLLLWSPSQINLRSSVMQEFSRLVGMGNSRPMWETGIWKNATHNLVTESRFERQ